MTAGPIISGEWLQAHLSDPQVRVIYVGDPGDYNRAHIPGARIVLYGDSPMAMAWVNTAIAAIGHGDEVSWLDPAKTKTRILDVRSQSEWNGGHLPNATLILWQDLFADVKTQKFKSLDEIRALLTKAGVGPDQDVVTYCAIGMRASLMYWAARSAGVPAHVYLGSWQDWSRNGANPIVK